ncbi:MAG: hypothetical protein HYW57_00785 [Ignavibacteriales bacterium]|nr:hypothetical protein [Ignavibacteriales bacterium]
MKNTVFFFPFLFTILFGIFDAAQTARKDYPSNSIFWAHSKEDWRLLSESYRDEEFRQKVRNGETKFDRFDLWYIGGNEFYSPARYFWTSDFWHFCKNMWVLCISGVGFSCILVGIRLKEELTRASADPTYKTGWKHRLILLAYGSYIFLYWVEGATFAFFYHHVFPR